MNPLNWGKALAIAMIILSVGASIGYFIAGDWKRGLYWLFAAGITSTVTF